MDKRWLTAADKYVREYRKLRAYVSGVEDAAGAGYEPTEAYLRAKRWVTAVESVDRLLCGSNADMHTFFVTFYGLYMPRYGHSDQAALLRLCDRLHISRSTAYVWRREILQLVVLAATQHGAIAPFSHD